MSPKASVKILTAAQERFPFSKDSPYRPKKADLDDLLRFEKTINVSHVCLVAMSVYGKDNRCLLDALKQLNGKARAVVSIDPVNISDDEMSSMHRLGVRGARLNLASFMRSMSRDEFVQLLHTYATRLRKYDWVLQIYIRMKQLPLIADELPKLGVPIVIDHLCYPDADIAASSRKVTTLSCLYCSDDRYTQS